MFIMISDHDHFVSVSVVSFWFALFWSMDSWPHWKFLGSEPDLNISFISGIDLNVLWINYLRKYVYTITVTIKGKTISCHIMVWLVYLKLFKYDMWLFFYSTASASKKQVSRNWNQKTYSKYIKFLKLGFRYSTVQYSTVYLPD